MAGHLLNRDDGESESPLGSADTRAFSKCDDKLGRWVRQVGVDSPFGGGDGGEACLSHRLQQLSGSFVSDWFQLSFLWSSPGSGMLLASVNVREVGSDNTGSRVLRPIFQRN